MLIVDASLPVVGEFWQRFINEHKKFWENGRMPADG